MEGLAGAPAGGAEEQKRGGASAGSARENALIEVLVDYYVINQRDVEKMMQLRNDPELSNRFLSIVLTRLIMNLRGFEMQGNTHGPTKWLDVFAHLAQRVYVHKNGNPEGFDPYHCARTVAEILGFEFPPLLEKREEVGAEVEWCTNILAESFLRTVMHEATIKDLVEIDVGFKHKGDSYDSHMALIKTLAETIGSEKSADTAGPDIAPASTGNEGEEQELSPSDEPPPPPGDLGLESTPSTNSSAGNRPSAGDGSDGSSSSDETAPPPPPPPPSDERPPPA